MVGVGTSPVIAGDFVVLAVMQTEGDSYLVAFDRKTGELAWKVDREYEVAVESGDEYTTPLVLEIEGVSQLVTWGGRPSDGSRGEGRAIDLDLRGI